MILRDFYMAYTLETFFIIQAHVSDCQLVFISRVQPSSTCDDIETNNRSLKGPTTHLLFRPIYLIICGIISDVITEAVIATHQGYASQQKKNYNKKEMKMEYQAYFINNFAGYVQFSFYRLLDRYPCIKKYICMLRWNLHYCLNVNLLL